MTRLHQVVAGLVILGAAASALADYPERLVKIVNPFSTGGTGDIVQRFYANELGKQTDKTFIVDNKTGASGRIGYESVARSKGDGYTLAAADATYTVLPGLYSKLPWDPASDLVPVTVYAKTPFVLVTSPNSRFKSLSSLLEYAKANPGKVTFGSAGIGSINHLVMELVGNEAGVRMTHVPYKGMGEALTGLLTDTVDVIATGMPTITGHLKSNKVTPLALTAEKRWPAAPNIPTFAEQNINVVTYSWLGLLAPKGTPKPVVEFLHQAVVKANKEPSTISWLDSQGLEGAGTSPEEFQKMLVNDTKRWGDIIRARNITAQ